MRNKEHEEALQLLRTIILKEPGGCKVVSLLQMIRCQIEMGQTMSAITICDEVSEILNLRLEDLDNLTRTKCHEELKIVVDLLIRMEKKVTAFLLLKGHFQLVKKSYAAEIKLRLLKELGSTLEKITKNMFRKNGNYNSNQCCVLLQEILREMQNLLQIDPEVKTRAIVAFLTHFGCCCNHLHHYDKSLELLRQAVFFMKSTFGDYAASYQVFGHCHLQIALALELSVKYHEAEDVCNETIHIYQQANDWESVMQKTNNLLLVSRVRENIMKKLEIYKLFWATDIFLAELESRKFCFFPSIPAKKSIYTIATPLLESTSQLQGQLRRVNSVNF